MIIYTVRTTCLHVHSYYSACHWLLFGYWNQSSIMQGTRQFWIWIYMRNVVPILKLNVINTNKHIYTWSYLLSKIYCVITRPRCINLSSLVIYYIYNRFSRSIGLFLAPCHSLRRQVNEMQIISVVIYLPAATCFRLSAIHTIWWPIYRHRGNRLISPVQWKLRDVEMTIVRHLNAITDRWTDNYAYLWVLFQYKKPFSQVQEAHFKYTTAVNYNMVCSALYKYNAL